MVMNVKQDVVPDRSALANSNEGNVVTSTWYKGGRGRGREVNHQGGHGGGGREAPRGGRRGGGGGIDRDKLYCTHCGRYQHTRETWWDLNGVPLQCVCHTS